MSRHVAWISRDLDDRDQIGIEQPQWRICAVLGVLPGSASS